eukprot:TRINITY_DN11827_c0_g1_i1.p1 TRINITY_DN11827_c0_g1~~TRINITY_DN11827_c0_g1_i1.p1  ORF type:complete len:458 (+),score=105.75 TRINITY_DN11827_c0_g1_i1:622-1995(+)
MPFSQMVSMVSWCNTSSKVLSCTLFTQPWTLLTKREQVHATSSSNTSSPSRSSSAPWRRKSVVSQSRFREEPRSPSRSPSALPVPPRIGGRTEGPPPPPRIISVPPDTLAMLLPMSGSGRQIREQVGSPATWLRRAMVSLSSAMVLYNVNVLLTAVAAFYWVWAPMLSAARTNISLRLQYQYVGLWRTQVKAVRVMEEPWQQQGQGPGLGPARRGRTLQVVLGDESGGPTAQIEVRVGSSRVRVVPGEAAELLVVSDRRSLSRFVALREVFLPEQQAWLAEGACLERAVLEDMSAELANWEALSQGDEQTVVAPSFRQRAGRGLEQRGDSRNRRRVGLINRQYDEDLMLRREEVEQEGRRWAPALPSGGTAVGSRPWQQQQAPSRNWEGQQRARRRGVLAEEYGYELGGEGRGEEDREVMFVESDRRKGSQPGLQQQQQQEQTLSASRDEEQQQRQL